MDDIKYCYENEVVMMKLIREGFKFDAAHRLVNYDGKCKMLHGHTYEFAIEVKVDDEIDESGISMDFGILKEIGRKIEDLFDHKLIVGSEEAKIIPLHDWFVRVEYEDGITLELPSMNIVVIEGYSTVECISKAIKKMVEKELDCEVSVYVSEGPKNIIVR